MVVVNRCGKQNGTLDRSAVMLEQRPTYISHRWRDATEVNRSDEKRLGEMKARKKCASEKKRGVKKCMT